MTTLTPRSTKIETYTQTNNLGTIPRYGLVQKLANSRFCFLVPQKLWVAIFPGPNHLKSLTLRTLTRR